MRLVFFQPDIPQNLGGAIRLAACFDAGLDIIEPCGFPLTDRALKRASLDYAPLARVCRHDSWAAYQASEPGGRLVLFTTSGAENLWDFNFQPDDRLLFGRESAGVTPDVSEAADARVRIPIRAEARSLNVTVSAGIALAEATRQLR